MELTKEYLVSKYSEFNHLIFDDSLPMIPIKLGRSKSALGYLKFRKHKNLFGKVTISGFSITISTKFDLSEQEIEDTLIHEMIHFYIYHNKLEDSSSHGHIFKKMMADINEKYGRKINISYRLTNTGELIPKGRKYLFF